MSEIANQHFASLLRKSPIARYSRNIPQVYARPASNKPNQEKDLTFGMKRQFCNNYWGRKLQYYQVTELEHEFGFPQFIDAQDKAHQFQALKELFYKFGTKPETVAESSYKYRKEKNLFSTPEIKKETKVEKNEEKIQPINTVLYGIHPPSCNKVVIGRLLNPLPEGYAIGIGGLVAYLPNSEIPSNFSFKPIDFQTKKSHEFYLKHVSIDYGNSKPSIILSMKE